MDLNIWEQQSLDLIYESVMDGDIVHTPDNVQTALDESIAPDRILNEGMIAAMTEVGRLFESGDNYVPEMLISARAMQAGLDAVIREHAHRGKTRRGAGRTGFNFSSQIIISRCHSEADRRVDLADLTEGIQGLEHEVALGNDVDREAKLRDHGQRASC